MSDRDDKAMDQAADKLSAAYLALHAVCHELPIAIMLPLDAATPGGCATAIIRAITVLDEEPLPMAVKRKAQLACIAWLNALDLFRLQDAAPRVYRMAGLALSLANLAESVAEVQAWLVEQE
ncbi:hypothetical protein ABZ369_22455 [Streptomyces sp. NPDC005918]|uniref:hypothetical protein n=1 Tax=Streptomyces sp. NPDC005918 TaxID=3155454 RepID=UPI0033FEF053